MKKFKLISIILLSIMFIFTVTTAVFADNEIDNGIWDDENTTDNSSWSDANETVNTLTENGSIFEDISDEENEALFENIGDEENESIFENNDEENEVENEIDEEDEYNNLYTTNNSTTSDSNSLAQTGIGDSSFMVIVIILSAIVAVYSIKKFNEYKNV